MTVRCHRRDDTGGVGRRGVLRGLGTGVAATALAGLPAAIPPAKAAGGLLGSGRRGGAVTELIVLTGVTPWLPAYQTVAAQYERKRKIRITLRPFPYAGMRTQMLNAIETKNPVFDVFQLDEPWLGQFYQNGWVRPLDDIIPGYKLDPNVLTYDALPFWDSKLRTSSPKGRLMGLPLNGNVDLFIYRKDLYQKLGLKLPRTWDEAIENGRRAQKSGAVKYTYVTRGQPTTGGQSITYEYMPVFYSYGANWFVDEGKNWTPAVNSPAAQAATATYRRLLELGPAKPQTVGQADVIALMQGGQALQGHFVAAAAAQLENPSRSDVVGKIGYAVVPAGPTGHAAPTSGTWSLCVPAQQTEPRQKAAADFILWMLQRSQQVDFVRAGGIPTRSDVLREAGSHIGYLKAVDASMPMVRRAVRYVFGAAMLDEVEPMLSQIGAGVVPVADGLNRLETELIKVVRDAGFLK